MKTTYPDEWVLLGNPEMNLATVKSGIVLFHSKDYLEVCYKGSELGAPFKSRTIIYTGETTQKTPQMVKSYSFRRTNSDDLIIVGGFVNEVTFPACC